MDVIVEGIVTDVNNVDFLKSIRNIDTPIIVRPEIKVTWVRGKNWPNALTPSK